MNKRISIAVIYLATACVALGQSCGDRTLLLHVTSGNISGLRLQMAEAEARRILAMAGVQVHWAAPRHGGVSPVDSLRELDVLIVDHSRPVDHAGALGYALPFAKTGYRIVIFNDRVAATDPGYQLLAHAIAHEVGHVLIGTVEHSKSGVMRARWSRVEVANMRSHSLRFSDQDLDMIGHRLTRCSFLLSAVNPPGF
jgi:hypothetical protein